MARTVVRQWPVLWYRRQILDTSTWVKRRQSDAGSYAARRGPWRTVREPHSIRVSSARPKPLFPSDDNQAVTTFNENYLPCWYSPECAVTYLESAYVWSDNGVVFTDKNELLNEFSPGWSVDAKSNPPYKYPFETFCRNIADANGLCAVLSVPGWDSYYHFLIQLVGRIHLLHPYESHIDYYIVPRGLQEWQLKILDCFNIKRDRLLPIAVNEKVRCKMLLATTIPSVEGAVPFWVIRFLDEHVRGSKQFGGERKLRVYLARGGRRRRVINENELCNFLLAHGWTVMNGDTTSWTDQIAIMKQASVIMGAHGAAMTNMLFANDATVLEVFPKNQIAQNCFDHLADICGHSYFWMLAEHTNSDGDFLMPLDKVQRAISLLDCRNTILDKA